jgi:signal transduction histidine kinase
MKGYMDQATTTEFEARMATLTEALRVSEERATAGRLALEMMHEIRNPLEAVGHLTYLTCAEAEDVEKVRKYMGMAEEQIDTLREIAGETLGFSRVSASPRPIELVTLAEAALRIHRRTIEKKKIHLVKDLPSGIVAEVYLGEMLQVLSNLIVNALDAMPSEKGALSLRLRKRGDEVHIVIADNGCGIGAEHSERVFQPFFTTKNERGTGLGLALSKKIVERHNGRIVMRSSVRPGRSGTMLRISLPA